MSKPFEVYSTVLVVSTVNGAEVEVEVEVHYEFTDRQPAYYDRDGLQEPACAAMVEVKDVFYSWCGVKHQLLLPFLTDHMMESLENEILESLDVGADA